jgi:CMP-N,N'-diacetyllegionaminic acid synthase
MNIVLIPARGGSKSIYKKNIALLGNKPLIYYTIEIAKQSKLIDKVFVSTDDIEIQSISENLGAEVPFLRPKEFANDISRDYDVIYHFLEWNKFDEINSLIYLRPDFPFRKLMLINEAIKKFRDSDCEILKSVFESKELPYFHLIKKNGFLSPVIDFNPDVLSSDDYKNLETIKNDYRLLLSKGVVARQFFPKPYYPSGYIDIFNPRFILKEKKIHSKRTIPFIVDEDCINIGSRDDLLMAEKIISNFNFEL